MNAGGVLVNDEGRKLSRMASPATPKEVNNNMEDDVEDIETTTAEIICEIAPRVSYSGEGLGMLHSGPKLKKNIATTNSVFLDFFSEEHVKGKRFKIPATNIGEQC